MLFLLKRILVLCLIGWCGLIGAEQVQILVSIAPYRYLVERIGGDRVQVELVVPPGASPHVFEPRPGQMKQAAAARIFFGIGEAFEPKVESVVRGYQPDLEMVNLREGLDLIPVEGCVHCAAHGGVDGHIWLSPRLVAIQARCIADALEKMNPENGPFHQQRLEVLLADLRVLDQEVRELLRGGRQRLLVSAHGAFGYFCRDYGLKPLSVEWHGRDRSPRQQTELLQAARAGGVHVLFTQQQYNDKAVRLLAGALKASVVEVDPYGEDLIHTIRTVAEALHD